MAGRSNAIILLLIVVSVTVGCVHFTPAAPVQSITQTIIISPDSVHPTLTQATANMRPTARPTTPEITQTTEPTYTFAPDTSSPPQTTWRFALIGDYGLAGPAAAQVAALIHAWKPDLVLTLGDNNYPLGGTETLDENVGQYFADYIFPYQGKYGPGGTENRFFPILGNHDLYTKMGQPYYDYFTLPNNERYYDFTWGPVHFFALNSDSSEPDGVGRSSSQANWLKRNLGMSHLSWQIVLMHHPPYSSGPRGPVDWMRWSFAAWGADILFAGHDHFYERLNIDGLPLVINGLGGGGIYNFGPIDPLSQVRYNAEHGALLITASIDVLEVEFYNIEGELIDQLIIKSGEQK